MNNRQFIQHVAKEAGVDERLAQGEVSALLRSLVGLLDDESALKIQGFGSFEVRKHLERLMRNPATGRQMLVPPKFVLTFRPGSQLQPLLQADGESSQPEANASQPDTAASQPDVAATRPNTDASHGD